MASTKITTNTDSLSRAADAILARGPNPSKNAILNALAAAIAGPGHDWGAIKHAPNGHFVQNGLSLGQPASATFRPYIVIFDEREDWCREPEGFATREEALSYIAQSDFLEGPERDAALAVLRTRNRVTIPIDEAEYEVCDSPASIEIHHLKMPSVTPRVPAAEDQEIPAPWILEISRKEGHDDPARAFTSQALALDAVRKLLLRDPEPLHPVDHVLETLSRYGEYDFAPEGEPSEAPDEDAWHEANDAAWRITLSQQPAETAPVSTLLWVNCPIALTEQGLDREYCLFADIEDRERVAVEQGLDLNPKYDGWREDVIALSDCQITADFLAQAWVRDWAMAVDPEGDTSWTIDPDEIDASQSDLDYLRDSRHAPSWVRDWGGPFEITLSFKTPKPVRKIVGYQVYNKKTDHYWDDGASFEILGYDLARRHQKAAEAADEYDYVIKVVREGDIEDPSYL